MAKRNKKKCMCIHVGNGKYRCFKRELGNLVDCGLGEFNSLGECMRVTGCEGVAPDPDADCNDADSTDT